MVSSGGLVPVPPAPLLPPAPAPTGAAATADGGAPGDAVTLAAIERALGARCGPFADLVVEQGLLSTEVQVAALRSTAELGGWENLFALRRGVYAPGTSTPGAPVPGFNAGDRVRLVKTYTPSSGSLELDRAYAGLAQPGERLELHVLHPEWELRPAVLAGLERCFLFDRIPLLPAGSTAAPGDLTGAYPWLTDPASVWGVEATTAGPSGALSTLGGEGAEADGLNSTASAPWNSAPLGALNDRLNDRLNDNGPWAGSFATNGLLPETWAPLYGWDAIQQAGRVFLVVPGGASGAWPTASLRVVVRRPAWTVVNGADWAPGRVWADGDVLEVALPYAAAAALVEAWRLARPRLTPLAQVAAAGQVPMWPTPQEAASELTRMTARHFRPDVRPPEERLVGPSRQRLPSGDTRGHADPRFGRAGPVVANS